MTRIAEKLGSRTVTPAIGDYAIIGDGRAAALIAKNGAIEWLCWPRFDSPFIFGALLDRKRGGAFAVQPSAPFEVRRRYLPDTNVLETTFETADGCARLTDLMPMFADEDHRQRLVPTRCVLRLLECIRGDISIEVAYAPRFDYGRVRPRLTRRGKQSVYGTHGALALLLQTTAPLALEDGVARARLTMRGGDKHVFILNCANQEPLTMMALDRVAGVLSDTVRFWQSWCAQWRYDGPYRDHVLRSTLVLKLLTYSPSGAIIAAPTTSLPERVGGVRNWDYRYCWLRDASITLRALTALGNFNDAERFLGWMLHTTRLSWPALQVLYDVYGETRLKERELTHLRGYRGSRPVRAGNDARDQLQLDVYGEVLDAAFEYACCSRRIFDRATARMLIGLGETVCRRWREPDNSIWETRSGRRHHTFSKVLCWVALDRLIRLHDVGAVKVPRGRYAEERAVIGHAVESRGYNERIESYVSTFDSDQVDGSLLLLPYYGYMPSRERMHTTYQRLRERLGEDGLFYRFRDDYADGLPPGEGTFAACAFWAAECRALLGEVAAARADFEQLLTCANDVGLYAEEIDAASGAALGNFPQLYTHVALINAALTLTGRPRATETTHEPR